MKKRNSNLELLRIFSMFLIIAHHYSVHGGFNLLMNTPGIEFNKSWLEFLGYGGKLGVNLFVLISSYFLVESKFSLTKLKNLFITVTFYSLSIYLIFIIFDPNLLGLKNTIKFTFPVFYNVWWFISTYILLYLFIDYINIFIKNLTKKQLEILIIMLILIKSILPSLFLMRMSQFSELSWFFLLYLIGGYIKLYLNQYNNFFINKSLPIGISIYFLSILSGVFFDFLGQFIPFFIGKHYHFAELYSPSILLCSIFIFIGFLKLNIKYNSLLNVIGSSTFIIYLIHDNPFVRNLLWIKLFKNYEYYNSKFLIFHSSLSIITVFIMCSVIDILYSKYIENILIFIVDKFFKIKK